MRTVASSSALFIAARSQTPSGCACWRVATPTPRRRRRRSAGGLSARAPPARGPRSGALWAPLEARAPRAIISIPRRNALFLSAAQGYIVHGEVGAQLGRGGRRGRAPKVNGTLADRIDARRRRLLGLCGPELHHASAARDAVPAQMVARRATSVPREHPAGSSSADAAEATAATALGGLSRKELLSVAKSYGVPANLPHHHRAAAGAGLAGRGARRASSPLAPPTELSAHVSSTQPVDKPAAGCVVYGVACL